MHHWLLRRISRWYVFYYHHPQLLIEAEYGNNGTKDSIVGFFYLDFIGIQIGAGIKAGEGLDKLLAIAGNGHLCHPA